MKTFLALGALAFASAVPSAHAGRLRAPAANDLAPSHLIALPAPAGEFERRPVSFAWPLDPQAALETPPPYLAESREWFVLADAAELRRGVAIETTAPGAVIRVSPVVGTAAVDPARVRLLKDGHPLAAPESFRRRADAAALKAAGMDVPDGSAVLQVAAAHGAGRFALQLPGATGRHLLHVYEPDSDLVLRAQAARTTVLAGDVLEVAAELRRGPQALAGGVLQGDLVAPDGRRFPLALRDGRARIVAPAADGPGLWEIRLYGGRDLDGRAVQREARTVVAIARPTARLAGGYAFDAGALRFELPVQVAAPGRYEARGTLYATAADGIARPVAQAHAAAWLVPGTGRLALAFAGHVPAGFGAPYELRQLELVDQARMATLETRAFAAREGGAPAVGAGPEPGTPGRRAMR
jgi:hypothetical protein